MQLPLPDPATLCEDLWPDLPSETGQSVYGSIPSVWSCVTRRERLWNCASSGNARKRQRYARGR
jgi:hypothetical protein